MMSSLQMIAIGRKLANLYNDLAAPICKKYGVNQTGFGILLFCANNPQYNTARDLCAVRGIKSGIVSVAVEQLIRSGFLFRCTDEADRRIHRLVPTEKAQLLIDEGREMQRIFTEALRQGITPEELTAFQSLTDKLTGNIANLERKENEQR